MLGRAAACTLALVLCAACDDGPRDVQVPLTWIIEAADGTHLTCAQAAASSVVVEFRPAGTGQQLTFTRDCSAGSGRYAVPGGYYELVFMTLTGGDGAALAGCTVFSEGVLDMGVESGLGPCVFRVQ